MAEHSLERIVEFVGDARDELTERGEFLGLRQPLAQLLALGLEPRLRRQVPGTTTRPTRSRSWLSRSVTVIMNGPFSTGSITSHVRGLWPSARTSESSCEASQVA